MGRPGLSAHPKFRRLAVLWGSRVTARGVLEVLWESTYDSVCDALGTPEEIAYILGMPDAEVTAIVTALVQCGLIDEDPHRPGEYRVHDLWDHCPNYVLDRLEHEVDRNVAPRRSQARELSLPSHPIPEEKEQALRAQPPVEKLSTTKAGKKTPTPKPLLRAAFHARELLAPDATETDLKEDIKRVAAQLHFDYGRDPQLITRVLEIVTHAKPLQATLRPRARQKAG